MLELDFSIRNESFWVAGGSEKRSVPDAESLAEERTEEPKRPCVREELQPVDPPVSELMDPFAHQERPATPQELLQLRDLIESQSSDVPRGQVDSCMDKPESIEDPFRHAGLFSDYGGIRGWLAVYGKKQY